MTISVYQSYQLAAKAVEEVCMRPYTIPSDRYRDYETLQRIERHNGHQPTGRGPRMPTIDYRGRLR